MSDRLTEELREAAERVESAKAAGLSDAQRREVGTSLRHRASGRYYNVVLPCNNCPSLTVAEVPYGTHCHDHFAEPENRMCSHCGCPSLIDDARQGPKTHDQIRELYWESLSPEDRESVRMRLA